MPDSPHVSPARSGPAFALVGDLYILRASGPQTGGTLCLVEARISPGGGPPPHVHAREDESFFVLEGEITFTTDVGAVRAGPGTFLHLPRGVAHTFRNDTQTEARMLFWCTPSGFDRFIEAVGAREDRADGAIPPPSPDQIDAIVRRAGDFGMTILDRPLGTGDGSAQHVGARE